MRNRHRIHGAFTLFEILLTLAVVGVLAALVVPSIDSRLKSIKLDSSTTDMRARLMQTRTRAMDEGRMWTFVVSNKVGQYTAFPTKSPGESLQWRLGESIQFVSESIDQPVYFHSDGTCTESTIKLQDQTGRESTVHISRLLGVQTER